MRTLAGSFIFVILVSVKLNGSDSFDFYKKNLKKFESAYGKRAKKRLEQYFSFMEKVKGKDTAFQLEAVNLFFNRFQYKTDIQNWNQREYWADPFEFIGQGAGDCEDFALAKYYSLKELGISSEKLKLSYAKLVDRRTKKRTPHIVLEYFNTSKNLSMVLDNSVKNIFPRKKRDDLIIIDNLKISNQIQSKIAKLFSFKV